MEKRDYEAILDSMQMTGIYVIREDNHQILYFNKRVQEVAPNIKTGMVCHELWAGTCANCPLLDIGERMESRSVNYDDPFGKAVDIVATRMMWEETIPAFSIAVTPHVDMVTYTYDKILKANLTTDSFEIVKVEKEERRDTKKQYSALSEWFSGIIEEGNIYHGDEERFRKFTQIEHLKEELNKEGNMAVCTYRYRKGRGFRWHMLEVVPDFNYSKKHQTVMLYVKDVHDVYRKGLELEVGNIQREIGRAQNDKRLATIIRSGYSVMKTVYTDTGMCEWVYLNEVTGLGKTQIGDYEAYIQRMMNETVHEEDIEKFLNAFSLENLRQKAAEVKSFSEIVCQYRLRKPKHVWMEEHIVFVRQEDSVAVNILGRDITEEKLKEEEYLKEKTERNYIINSMSRLFFATYYIDLEADTFRTVTQNEAVGNALRASSRCTEGFQIYARNFVHPEYREEYLKKMSCKNLQKVLSKEHPIFAMEYRRIKKEEGKIKDDGWIRATVVLSETKRGKPSKAVYVAQDVTESKEKEEREHRILKEAYEAAIQANASKSDFLSKMSHDIRTPMNAIIGMTAIAEAHLEDREKVSDCLNKITISSKHLLSSINEVLDMSKIESGKIDLVEEEFNLSDMIQNVLTMIRPVVQAKQHEMTLRITKVEHEFVVGDVMRLQQVFMNILGNAAKYTPPGGKLELQISEKASEIYGYGCYEFVFKDNGIGMSKEFQRHIFEPFSRAEDSRVSKVEGTGLGMTITLSIIQMMNGDISIESKEGEGSKFTVTVFLKKQNTVAEGMEQFKGLPVLVVDDDKNSCEATCQLVADMGMQSEGAQSGKEAVLRASKAHREGKDFFAVILDWKMADMDGIQTAEAIRKKVGEKVLLIMLSAYDWSDVETQARQAGVDGFIAKPLFKSRLMYLLKEMAREEPKEKEAESGMLLNQDFGNKRILLVEDNELNREIAEEIIKSSGAIVESAVDGKQALEKFEQKDEWYYDLIFMDIQMPVMNGHEATRAIRRLKREDARKIPIIAMTANAFTEDVIASKKAGMNEHITKPLNIEQLTECMKRWLLQNN